MRILVGTNEIAGTIKSLADGFRSLGHQVTTVVRSRNHFYADVEYDLEIGHSAPDPVSWPIWVRKSRNPLIRFPRGATNRICNALKWADIVRKHDLFVFPWCGDSLTVGNKEFGLLKRLGKKIVSIPLGSDIRHPVVFSAEFADLPLSAEFRNRLDQKASSVGMAQLWNLRNAEYYSDVLLSVPNQSGLAVRPYGHLFIPVNACEIRCEIPGRDTPVVVHAPSARGIKGTEDILGVCRRLQQQGIRFELRLLERMTNNEVLSELRQADVVIDQIYLPLHGKLGAEAMASGCALASCNHEAYEPYPPQRPIWHIDRSNLENQLRELLTNRAIRVRLAVEGRKYVETHHDQVQVAKHIIGLIRNPENVGFRHYPSFFVRGFQLQADGAIPRQLRRMTARIVARWGLPPDVDPDDLARRGLMARLSQFERERLPRWPAFPEGDATETNKEHPSEALV